jgi:Rhodanese-like domain
MKRAGSPLSPPSSSTTRLASSSSSSSSSSSTLIDTLLGGGGGGGGGGSNDDKVAVVVSIPDALQLHGNPRVKFVDGSWFLSGRNGKEEFLTGPRIQGAIFFDINDIADTTTKPNLKHMMPTQDLFAAYMDAAGISNDDHVIVYGSKDCVRT